MQVDSIQSPVKNSFQAVDAFILDSLQSKASIINDLGRYILHSGGKRLRPLIVLLIAQACGYKGRDDIKLAAVIEFIHTATLLHDDVVDESELRRGQKTASRVWGNEAAVLVGDYLYSKAFQIMVSVGHLKIMAVIADATNIMTEGEALQLMDRHNPDATEGGYLNIIQSKTAKLFEVSAKIGAILGNAEPSLEEAMGHYGMHLGIAFQLIDDVLDYRSSPRQTGKNLGADLGEGKVTLPLIYILQNGTSQEIQLVRRSIQEGGKQHFEEIQTLLETTGALEYTLRYARREAARAVKSLIKLPPSPSREAAIELAEFAVERHF